MAARCLASTIKSRRSSFAMSTASLVMRCFGCPSSSSFLVSAGSRVVTVIAAGVENASSSSKVYMRSKVKACIYAFLRRAKKKLCLSDVNSLQRHRVATRRQNGQPAPTRVQKLSTFRVAVSRMSLPSVDSCSHKGKQT
jgi:hypothetical protein